MSHPTDPRSALVTGASRGIGRGAAIGLARRGFALTVTSRSEEDLVALAGDLRDAGAPDVGYLAVDLADRDALSGLVDLHEARFGTLDLLLLNAGIGSAGNVAAYPLRRYDRTVDVNLTSAVVLLGRAIPLLRAAAAARPATGARVICLSSITGVYAEAGLAVYGATKAALISLMATVNLEEGVNGVSATAIAPAYVDTDMSAWAADRIPTETMIPVEDVVAVIEMIAGLSRNTTIPRLVMTRTGTSVYTA